jgi:hypothetical protein
MTTFASPRFQGDDLLDRILDDPDTGEVKLGPGSPEQSVITGQHAVFDLGWNLRIVPVVAEETYFVDSIYGQRTTDAVTAYKRGYDMPPSDPTGFIDGFAGTRTFRKLDEHCVLLDEASAAIRAKVNDLDLAVPLPSPNPTSTPPKACWQLRDIYLLRDPSSAASTSVCSVRRHPRSLAIWAGADQRQWPR